MSIIKVGPSYLANHDLLPPEVANHVGVVRRQDALRSMNGGDVTMTRLVALTRGGVSDAQYLLSIGAQNIQPSPLLAPEFFKCTGVKLVPSSPFHRPLHGTYGVMVPSPAQEANQAQYVQAAAPAHVGNAQELVGRYFQISYYSALTRVYWYAFLLGQPNTSFRLYVEDGVFSFGDYPGERYIIEGTHVDAYAPIQGF
jgi:hypothetical protein